MPLPTCWSLIPTSPVGYCSVTREAATALTLTLQGFLKTSISKDCLLASPVWRLQCAVFRDPPTTFDGGPGSERYVWGSLKTILWLFQAEEAWTHLQILPTLLLTLEQEQKGGRWRSWWEIFRNIPQPHHQGELEKGKEISGNVIPYSSDPEAAIFFMETHVHSLETSCNSWRILASTWRSATQQIQVNTLHTLSPALIFFKACQKTVIWISFP